MASSAAAAAPGLPPWLWVLAGGTGGSALLTGVFLVQAGSKDRELERFRPDPAAPEAAPSKIEQLQAEGRSAQTRARIVGALSAGLGASTAVGYWFSMRANEASAGALGLDARRHGLSASWKTSF